MNTQTHTQPQAPGSSSVADSVRRLSDAAAESLASRRGPVSAESLARALTDGPWLDELMSHVNADGSGLRLTGEDGFLPALVKAVLEKGLAVEMADHLGYEKGDPAGRGSGNSRNGSTPKSLDTEVGEIDLDTPRDRNSSFEPRLVPKGARRVTGGSPAGWTR